MKLRQKLAAVLAATMIVTAVPVVTMAASTNKLSQTVTVVEGSTIGYAVGTVAPTTTVTGVGTVAASYLAADMTANVKVIIEGDAQGATEFYINAVDGEFEKAAYYAWATGLDVYKDKATEAYIDENGVNIKNASSSALTTSVSGTPGATDEVTVEWLSSSQLKVVVGRTVNKNFNVPFLMKAKKGTPAIEIDGADSRVSSSTLAVATGEVTGKLNLTATSGTAKNIDVDGKGTLADVIFAEKAPGAFGATRTFTVKLPAKSELEFTWDNDTKVTGTRGLANKGAALSTIEYVAGSDRKEVRVTITSGLSATWGEIKLQGLKVVAADSRKEVKEHDVKVTVVERDTVNNKDITTNMEKATLTVGKVVGYGASMTIADADKVEIVAGKVDRNEPYSKVKVKVKENVSNSFTAGRKVYFTLENALFVDEDGIAYKDQEIGETPVLKDGEWEVEFLVRAAAGVEGDITLTAESRDFDKNLELVVGEVKAPVTVEATTFVVENGVKAQKGGKVVITETGAENLAKGEKIYLDIEDLGIYDAKVVAEDIEVEYEVVRGILEITVKTPSDEAGVITVTDIETSVSGAMARGQYKLEVYGDAITTLGQYNGKVSNGAPVVEADCLEVKGFVQVGEDVKTERVDATINVSAGTATRNGETVALLATPYIDGTTGRTMVGVRDIATLFGISEDKIDYANGVVTIINGNEIVQIKKGSKILNKGGANFEMDAEMTIKDDGRAYVPFRFLAIALNLNVDYDNGVVEFWNYIK